MTSKPFHHHPVAFTCFDRVPPTGDAQVAGFDAHSSPQTGGIQPRLLALVAVALVMLAAVYFILAPRLVSTPGGADTKVTKTETEPTPDMPAIRAKAEQGDAEAQKNLALVYVKGQGVKQDYDEAVKWYRLAAEQGNAAAQNAMGELCEAGRGTAQSDSEAAKWFRLAAEQGHTSAQYSLAVLYAVGKGVAQDDAEAVKWYFKAAERGDSLAQYNIGKRFVDGRGVKQDLVDAFKWLSLAKADGLPDAAAALEQIQPRMTREQIAEGKRQVAAFVVLKPTATGK